MNNSVELKAGRELDALVAEKVMGDLPPRGYSIPDYSIFISAAWAVVEKLYLTSEFFLETSYYGMDKNKRWWAQFSTHGIDDEFHAEAPTAPLAICRAALKAVENL